MQKITPFLWFDENAEEAADFYASVFPNSRISGVARSSADTPSGPKGSVLTVSFELDGNKFMALNGGDRFKFNESVSFVITCKDQSEIDYFWSKLSAVPESEQCGWLKDKFGLSWQVVPENIGGLLKEEKAMQALLKMKKIDIAALESAGR
ncbi:VOC family protein [Patescibacteria group bacterium]|nr:VOC family protein [Patescibacteria group bacterium]